MLEKWKVVVCAHIRYPAGAKQPVHLFLGGKGLGIQQGMSLQVGLPKFKETPSLKSYLSCGNFKDCVGHLTFSLLLDILAWEKDSSAKGIKCE